MIPTYDRAFVIVEAGSLEEACAHGIEAARTSGEWDGTLIYGQVFVEGVAARPGDDPVQDIYDSGADVPSRYAEGGAA